MEIFKNSVVFLEMSHSIKSRINTPECPFLHYLDYYTP